LEFLSSFEVCGKCQKIQRLGENFDGGYLMCMENLQVGRILAGMSMGVERHDKWSGDFSDLLHVPVYQYDCTVDSPPAGCNNCKFFQKCMRAADGLNDPFAGRSWTLQEAIAGAGLSDAPERSLVLKIDVEDSEWRIFAAENVSTFRKFQQILVEYHNVGAYATAHQEYLLGMKNVLNAGFTVTHIHGNNFGPMGYIGEYSIPEVLEVTFEAGSTLRNECVKGIDYLPLDMPNNPGARDFFHANLARL
jgi:hypothetical protein